MKVRALLAVIWIAGTLGAQTAPSQAGATVPYPRAISSAADQIAERQFDAAARTLEATEIAARGFEWSHLKLALDLARAASVEPGLRAAGRARTSNSSVRVEPISELQGHALNCRAVAIAPRGERIASSGDEQGLRSWNGHTGDVERVLGAGTGTLTGLAFSPNGDRIASASTDGTARVWDAVDGRALLKLASGTDALTALAWSPDGAWIATADAAFVVHVWHSSSEEARFALRGHIGPITSIAFSGDSKLVASSSEDGTVRIVDVASGDVVRTLKVAGIQARACCFEPGGERIAIAFADGSIRRFVLPGGERGQVIASPNGVVQTIAFTGDGQRFVTGTDQGSVQVWDVTGTPLLELRVSSSPIRCLSFDARASRLAVCGDDHSVRVIETEADVARTMQRARVRTLPSIEAALAMRPLEVEALCRRVVERAGLDTKLYADAEALARATLDRLAGSGQARTTLGAAIYRLERFDEALVVLAQANDEKRGFPPNLAFRVMTLARLERRDEALELQKRLDTLMLEKRWQDDAEARALVDEARALVSASKPAPK